MSNNEWLIALGAAALCAAGLGCGWWLLCVAAVLLLALCGYSVFALLLSLLLDLYFGVPVGALHVLVLPVSITTLVVVLCRSYLVRHLRNTRVY